MRGTDKLYNAKVKRAGSGHGLRLFAAGMEPVNGSSIQGQPPGSAVVLSGTEPRRQPSARPSPLAGCELKRFFMLLASLPTTCVVLSASPSFWGEKLGYSRTTVGLTRSP